MEIEDWYEIIVANQRRSKLMVHTLEELHEEGEVDRVLSLMPRAKDMLAQGQESLALLKRLPPSAVDGQGDRLIQSVAEELQEQVEKFDSISRSLSLQTPEYHKVDWCSTAENAVRKRESGRRGILARPTNQMPPSPSIPTSHPISPHPPETTKLILKPNSGAMCTTIPMEIEEWYEIIVANQRRSALIIHSLEEFIEEGEDDIVLTLIPKLKDMLAQGEESLALLKRLLPAEVDGKGTQFVQSVAEELIEQVLIFEIVSGNMLLQPLDYIS